jgi:ATP-dependent Clp protease adapter protein ClpS
MEFVLSSLTEHLGLDHTQAFKTMAHIHNNGGILIAFESKDRAEAVASAITADSARQGHALVCRAVDVKS